MKLESKEKEREGTGLALDRETRVEFADGVQDRTAIGKIGSGK